MQFIFDIMFGIALLGLWILGLWFLGWKWWIEPSFFAWRERQWGWLALLIVGHWWAGLAYLYLKVDDYVVAEPSQYAKGDTMVWHGRMYRVIGHSRDSVRCLDLGERHPWAVR